MPQFINREIVFLIAGLTIGACIPWKDLFSHKEIASPLPISINPGNESSISKNSSRLDLPLDKILVSSIPGLPPRPLTMQYASTIQSTVQGIISGKNKELDPYSVLSQYPATEVLYQLHDIWYHTNPELDNALKWIIDLAWQMNPTQAKHTLITFFQNPNTKDLGIASLFEMFQNTATVSDAHNILITLLQKNEPDTRMAALEVTSLLPGALKPDLQSILWDFVKQTKEPQLAEMAYEILSTQEDFIKFEALFDLMPNVCHPVLKSMVYDLLNSNNREIYDKIFKVAKASFSIQDLILEYLESKELPEVESFLLDLLPDVSETQQIKIIKLLSKYYTTTNSLQAMAVFLDSKEGSFLDEVILALQTMTKKKFGYEFGFEKQINAEPIRKWKQFLSQI